MTVEIDLLEILMGLNNVNSCKFTLKLNEKEYDLEDVSIINSPTPVNSPTTRGGVYFSEKFAYKIKGSIQDLSIVPLLSKTMLGPNTEFREIKGDSYLHHEIGSISSIYPNLFKVKKVCKKTSGQEE